MGYRGPMKILIVDDNPDMRNLLERLIKLMGYVAISAENGAEGCEKAIEKKPDLILVDVMMRHMDGCEVARTLRTYPDTKGIPILATTALSRPSDLEACLEAGCNDYILKPFSCLDLRAKIGELLKSRYI